MSYEAALSRIDIIQSRITGTPSTASELRRAEPVRTATDSASFAAQLNNAQAAAPASPVASAASAAQVSQAGAAAPAEIEQLIQSKGAKYDVDPNLIRAVIRQESGFNASAGSPAGAQGLMQLMPATAAGLGVTDPLNAEQNVDGGVRYLKQQLDTFDGDVRKALAAYNAGPGAVRKYDGVPPYPETQNYVAKITAELGL